MLQPVHRPRLSLQTDPVYALWPNGYGLSQTKYYNCYYYIFLIAEVQASK
jgi:hypothetical protein